MSNEHNQQNNEILRSVVLDIDEGSNHGVSINFK